MQELAPGSRYGSFQITNKLGRGLTGPVYRAVYLKDGTHVALKFLEQRDASVKSYFFNEMGLLRRAKEHDRNHQHLVEYVASYTTQEPYCLATRFYEDGQELTELLRKGLVPGLALRIVEQTAGALDYLHYGHPDAPVVHRDIKPANLMVNPAGDVLVIDLSAARHPNFMLENERGLGTPQYMPPEQYLADEQPQTDQFALAMVAFQMLTGKTLLGSAPDHESKQMASLRDSGYARIRDGMRSMPSVAEVIVRGVAFDWRLRYPTCEEFAYELHRALASDGVSLEIVAPAPSRFSGKPWVGYAVMATVAVVALGVLVANPFDGGGPPAAPTRIPPSVTSVVDTVPGITLNPPPSERTSGISPTSILLPTTKTGTGAGASSQITSVGCALREAPSTDAIILPYSAQSRIIPPDVALTVLGHSDNWYHVQSSNGSSGWCPGYQTSLGGSPAPAAVAPRPAAPRPAAPRPAAPTASPAPPPVQATTYYEPPTAIPEPPTNTRVPPTPTKKPHTGDNGGPAEVGGGGGGDNPVPAPSYP